ncbi:MAG TPA: DUF4398 domain-containing protein [Thermoanaerobaculia bacterium]|nr:DUF4398 domain-containing protein [Thermoanaerobaculia bacterium]
MVRTVIRTVVSALALAALPAIAGCAKAPTKELQSAQTSLNEARSSGSEAYAPEAFSKAQQTFEQAKAEVAAQDKKLAPLRSYGKAVALLAQARTDADTAKVQAVSGKEQFKGQAEKALDDARTAIAAARSSLATAPKGKDSRADLEAMKGDLDGLDTALTDAQGAYTGGDYATAKQKAEQVAQQARAVQDDIAKARMKAMGH